MFLFFCRIFLLNSTDLAGRGTLGPHNLVTFGVAVLLFEVRQVPTVAHRTSDRDTGKVSGLF